MTVKNDKCFFWKIRIGDHTAFLIGSIHLMPKNMHPLPDKFEKAFSLSPIIVIETNPDDVTSHEVRQYVRSVGFYPHGETIWKNISAKMQKKLMQKLSEKQFPVHMAEKIRPWLLSTMLEDKEEEDSDSKMHHALGIDMYFFRKALQEGKTLMFLETAQDQIDCTAKLPPAQQEFLLKDALEKKLAKGEIPLHKVLELWKKGDADTLEFHYRNHHKKHMEIYRSVMVRRNIRWVKKMEQMFQLRQNLMIIAGGGHMGGPHGLVRLLADKGYQIVQE